MYVLDFSTDSGRVLDVETEVHQNSGRHERGHDDLKGVEPCQRGVRGGDNLRTEVTEGPLAQPRRGYIFHHISFSSVDGVRVGRIFYLQLCTGTLSNGSAMNTDLVSFLDV